MWVIDAGRMEVKAGPAQYCWLGFLPCGTQIISVLEVVESRAALLDSGFMLRNGFSHVSFTPCRLTADFIRLLGNFFRSKSALAAENLFLRKQLSLYQERRVRPHRATDAIRLTMVLVAKLFDWRDALITVRPETFIGWHRRGFRMFWRWKSRRIGRPRIPNDLRELILACRKIIPHGDRLA